MDADGSHIIDKHRLLAGRIPLKSQINQEDFSIDSGCCLHSMCEHFRLASVMRLKIVRTVSISIEVQPEWL